jgi:hypothetical protein
MSAAPINISTTQPAISSATSGPVNAGNITIIGDPTGYANLLAQQEGPSVNGGTGGGQSNALTGAGSYTQSALSAFEAVTGGQGVAGGVAGASTAQASTSVTTTNWLLWGAVAVVGLLLCRRMK